jgi:hypothetical protein
MPERHDHGKNFSGKDRIKLYAKSLILQVYDRLARHNLARTHLSPEPSRPGLLVCNEDTECAVSAVSFSGKRQENLEIRPKS